MLRVVFLILPFFIGFYGFLHLEGITILWAAYYAIRLYGLNTDLAEINTYVEIARWLAPIATTAAILSVLQGLLVRIRNRIRSLSDESCSVYGENTEAELLLENLGKYGVKGDLDKPLNSEYHIVFGENDQEGMQFYTKNKELFDQKRPFSFWRKLEHTRYKVFVSLNEVSPLALQQNNLTAFSNENNCAAQYWDQFPATTGEKIGFIGSGTLCEALLSNSLLVNIISADQRIEYHVWADLDHFTSIHGNLDKILETTGDRLRIYPDSFYKSGELISKMDRIIFCDKEDLNLVNAANLAAYHYCPTLYVFTREEGIVKTMLPQHNIIEFGEAKRYLTKEIIIKEKLLEEAKHIHASYQKKYKELPDWADLNTMTRHSNVSAANYFEVIRELYHRGMSIEKLTELEHIRWCRFHYFYNWNYGNEKNTAMRQHPCLVSFSELSEEEKLKDRENVYLAIGS